MSKLNYSRTALKNLRWLSVVLFLFTCTVSLTPPLFGDEETESGDGKLAADQPVEASDEGEQAMSTFRTPKGWKVSLFAAEPELANPVAMYIDNKGRVFVCESFRQDRGITDNRKHDQEWLMADLAAESVQDRIDYHLRLLGSEAAQYTAHDDRIRMLVDTDADGVADKATIFAEGFNKLEEGTGAGVLVRDNQAYFTCIPKLWLLTDSNDDGIADQRDALQDGYGVRVAFRGHDSHGLIIGPDGRLYFSIGDRGYNIETEDGSIKNVESGAVFRCELDGSNLEVFASGLRNPQELAFDDYGYLFTGDNNSDSGDKARWVNVMEGGDTGWRMMYQYLPDRGPFNREKIWHPYSDDSPAYTVPPIANIGDGPSGLTCYPGTGLTGDYANCFFLCDFRGGPSNSGVRLIRTQPKGAFWKVERSEEPLWSILATDADFGPDGALWVCDWVNGWVGEGKGRVYRFEDTEAQKQDVVREVESLLHAGFKDINTEELTSLLQHLDRRIRLEAQWELANRGETSALLDTLRDRGAGTLARLHAIWGLGHAARLNPELRDQAAEGLEIAMSDQDLDVRASAAKVVGELLLKQFSPKVVELILDDEPRVQYAACIAAGRLKISDSFTSVCTMLTANADRDPGLRHAGIMAFTGIPADSLSDLASHSSRSVRIAAVVALRKLADTNISAFLSDKDAGVQLEAVRAVNDVIELHSLLSQLAALEIDDSSNPAMVHRVLNANFRLSGSEAAPRIALYAANKNADASMRVEAINMLGDWAEPGQLDRVMNRYLPLTSRNSTEAAKALESIFNQLLTGSTEIQQAAIDAAVSLNITSVATGLEELALDANNESEVRTHALNGSVGLNRSNAKTLVMSLVEDSDLSVRSQAVKLLAELSPSDALPELNKAVRSDFMVERQMAWDTLATLGSDEAKQTIELGLSRYLAGELPADVWLNVTEASSKQLGETAVEKIASFVEADSAENSLAEYRDCLAGGDVEAGKNLFFFKTELSCVRCHKAGDTGGEVGPELTAIGKDKDRRYLLESIVAPDAKIAEKFETVVLLTEDDEIISGILRSDTPSRLELINAEGEIVRVDPESIVARKKGKSSMPVDLLKSMTRRELRDIVAYLASLKGEAE